MQTVRQRLVLVLALSNAFGKQPILDVEAHPQPPRGLARLGEVAEALTELECRKNGGPRSDSHAGIAFLDSRDCLARGERAGGKCSYGDAVPPAAKTELSTELLQHLEGAGSELTVGFWHFGQGSIWVTQSPLQVMRDLPLVAVGGAKLVPSGGTCATAALQGGSAHCRADRPIARRIGALRGIFVGLGRSSGTLRSRVAVRGIAPQRTRQITYLKSHPSEPC